MPARPAPPQVARESDFAGRFTWRIEHFTRLKDLLKKRKITGLCIKSRRFTIGGRDCRLIVYPRGALRRAAPRCASPAVPCSACVRAERDEGGSRKGALRVAQHGGRGEEGRAICKGT